MNREQEYPKLLESCRNPKAAAYNCFIALSSAA